MEIIILLTIAAIVLDLAALRWGADTRDTIDSPEWKRRCHFRNTKIGTGQQIY